MILCLFLQLLKQFLGDVNGHSDLRVGDGALADG